MVATAVKERRRGAAPIPEDVDGMLTDSQRLTLQQIDSFGWCLCFVRRPLFQDITIVVSHEDSGAVALLDVDGHLDRGAGVSLRA